jgi:protein gp37
VSKTKIEWAEHTWNTVTGCTKISAGCKHCYAETMTRRLQAMGQGKYAAGFGEVRCHPQSLEEPLRRRKPTTYFVNSMSDTFHQDVPDEFIADIWRVMGRGHQHRFLVLTKRSERMAEWLSGRLGFLPNVWLGVTVENKDALPRVADLMRCPAAGRFVSCEPLLGPIDFPGDWWCRTCGYLDGFRVNHDETCDICGREVHVDSILGVGRDEARGIDALVAGAETGPKARPCDIEWAQDLRDQATDAGVPFMWKKWADGTRELDGRVWDETPWGDDA